MRSRQAPSTVLAVRAAAGLVVALASASCGEFWLADRPVAAPRSAEAPPPPRVVTRRMSAPEVAAELCRMLKSPSPGRLEKLKQHCTEELDGLAKEGAAIFDADAIPGCLEAGTAEPTPALRGIADLLRLPACNRVVVGGLKEGAKCTLFPLGCGPDVFCNLKTERCERSGRAEGAACVDTSVSGARSCGDGLHCHEGPSGAVCAPDRGPGASCTRSRHCKAPLLCAGGVCRESPGKVDEACDALDPRTCERDAYCDKKCEPRQPKGKHCSTDAACKSGDCDIGGKDVCQ